MIIDEILDLLQKFSATREASYKSRQASCKWSTISLILGLFKIFSEVTVASKLASLGTIEKYVMPQNLDLLKSFSKIREASGP